MFSESGEFLRSDLVPSSFGIWPRPLHVTRAGTLLGQIPQALERIPANGSMLRDTVRIWTMSLDGTAPTLVSQTPGPLRFFHDGLQVEVPYTGGFPSPHADGTPAAFRDDRVYVTDKTGEASYSVYGPAGLERRVEIDRSPRRIDGFSATDFVEYLRRGRYPESRVRIYEEHLSEMPIPGARRAWDRMVVTDEGAAWLLRAGDAAAAMTGVPPDEKVWDVFDAKGVFAGHVRLPANVFLVQVGGQSALTTVHDELGRVTVAIHDIRWTG